MEDSCMEFLTGFGMIEDDEIVSWIWRCFPSRRVSYTSPTKKTLEAPSNSCHGLLWIGEDVLGSYLFSLSMQKCGRNLMLVSQTDDPRLCPFPVRMKPASSLCRLPSFSSSSIISNPVKKTLYLMTSLVFAYLNHHFSWGQCFGISLFLSSACWPLFPFAG